MALVKGTNCGFVTVAPTAIPDGAGNLVPDNISTALKDTTPAGDIRITEIGWFSTNATQEANFEVGIYDHNVGDNNPESLLGGVSRTNAKGTDEGWKVVSGLDIRLGGGVDYWIAFQLDNTPTGTVLEFDADAGEKTDTIAAQTTLIDTWGVSSTTDAGLCAIYAVVEIVPTSNPNEGTVSTKGISKTDIPEGIGDVQNLIPEGLNGVTSTVLSKERVGLEM